MTRPLAEDFVEGRAAVRRRIDAVLTDSPGEWAVESAGLQFSWGALATAVARIDEELEHAAPGVQASIIVIPRNRVTGVVAILASLYSGRCAQIVSPVQPAAAIAADAARLDASAVIADSDDWSPELDEGVVKRGCAGVEIVQRGGELSVVLRHAGSRESELTAGTSYPDGAVVLPTSGTTGPPKRIRINWNQLPFEVTEPLQSLARRRPVINALPLVTVAGLGTSLRAISRGRPLALLERVDVVQWAALVKRHQPRIAGLPPAAMRMLLDAAVPKEDLASLRAWPTGSAPLDPKLQEEFEAVYGIPVLVSYGATEFGGPVVGWSLELHARWAEQKRGSVGRALSGVSLRVIDPATDEEVGSGSSGILEVRAPRAPIGPDAWIRTNDRARIDDDGFVFIEGRADDVIIRGGFKIPIDELEDVLRTHPAVLDAAAVGLPDPRLGQVPVAAVVVRPEAGSITEQELTEWLRGRIAPYKIPTTIRTVAELPRNASMKVSRPLLQELFAETR